ncbi:BadF/BadG/BcrA/BcrD ATPase family protein [Paenibacillus sp. YPG26]|uniref:N-acetylglucosamine kinase n=1 Tax=Paenibacillus sp. YPG26 TaxID=2878915 RepID=UPI00203BF09C|nr:BadF/BadG/BcrA/BcrD ATPase family protein [Paenibacillus sp. YPG26]USB33107.1 ATPase [Paenibacillus sp. YPG26]
MGQVTELTDQADKVVIGIDGGGTHTRAMVCNLRGEVLAYTEKGPASIYRDASAARNVTGAIEEALVQAGKSPEQVLGVAAGIAGYDTEDDLAWIMTLTRLPGLICPTWHVNDAVIAHQGALGMQPGIVVIAGTGSNILAITEEGQQLRNDQFHHYAASGARLIAYDAVYEILAGNTDSTDEGLIAAMKTHWHVETLSEFYQLAKKGFEADRQLRDRTFGRFAPWITEAASQGSSTAMRVCDRAVSQIKVGVELLGSSFANESVDVVLIGGVANSTYVSRALTRQLQCGSHRRYQVHKPILSPVAGAILLALHELGMPVLPAVITNLQRSPFARGSKEQPAGH